MTPARFSVLSCLARLRPPRLVLAGGALLRALGGVLTLACALSPGLAGAEGCGPAAGGPPVCESGVASTGGGGPDVGAGNPINVITGNKYQREEDMPALPGVLGLEIVRHYNSAYGAPGARIGPVGRGWRLSYETELLDAGGRIQILQADGGRLIFERDRNDPSLCGTANPANGALLLDRKANGLVEYDWIWANGRRLHFNSAGKLERIAAPSGETVDLLYDGRNALVRVIDPRGRSLSLAYLGKAGDRFNGVRYIDSPVGRFAYEYGAASGEGGRLDERARMANLARVRLPTGYDTQRKAHPLSSRGATTSTVSRVYHYEDRRFPTLLTGISVESGGDRPVLSRISTFGYDVNGRAVLSTHADGVGKITLDTGVGGRTVLTNSLGQKTTYLHAIVGGQHRLLEVRGAGCALCGETNVRYGYNGAGQLTETTRLDVNGKPVATTRTEFDKLGRALRIGQLTYPQGKAQPIQWLTRFAYRGDGFAPVVVARPSMVPGKEALTRIAYNAAGQALSVTETGWTPALDGGQPPVRMERTTRYRYTVINGKSLLAEIDGPLPNGKTNSPLDSDITVIEYDQRRDAAAPKAAPTRAGLAQYERRDGLVTRVIAPGGRVTTILARDAAGRPTRVGAPGGIELGYEFDFRGHLVRRDAAGISEFLSYNALGQLASVRQASGQTVNFAYGADGRVSEMFDAQNNRIRITRDTEGALRARTLLDPDGGVAQQTDLSRPTADPEAPSTPIQGPEPVDRFGVAGDAANGAEGLPGTLPTPDNAAIRLAYDKMRRLTRFTDARGLDSAYAYDDFGRLARAGSADAGVTVFRYDAADHVIGKTSGYGTGQASTLLYRYDAAGRVVEQTSAEGRTTIRYGPSGRPDKIVFPAGEEHYRYDHAARLIAHTRVIDGHRFTTGYEYDERGRLKRKSLPDGQFLLYRYHGAMHPKAGLLAGIFRQDLFGQTALLDGLNDADDGYARQRYRLANGIEFVRELDRGGHIARIGSPGVWEESHRRDAAGRLMARDPVGATATRASYSYDAFGRLAGQAGSGDQAGARGYAYDAGGNLLALLSGKSLTRYRIGAGGNRILDAQTDGRLLPYAYNAAGGVDRIGDTSYAWDSQQRLSAVARAGKPLAEYAYNPFGERIKKVSYANNQKSVTYFFYDGQRLVAEAEPNAGAITVTRQYVWLDDAGGGRPIALLRARSPQSLAGKVLAAIPAGRVRAAALARRTDVFAIVADHTGAPRALVDEDRRAVWRAEVAGYGEVIPGAGNLVALNLRGSNQYFDQETQLHYNYHRYLDPASGRYLSADPSGLAGGSNPYVFGDNNPISRLDPLGLQSKPAGAVGGWSFADKLKYVVERVADNYPDELGSALKELVSPAALAATASIFGIWSAAQFTPYGWAADVAIAGIGYALVGKAIWDVIAGIYDSSSLIVNAKCEKDLQDAGDILAKGFGGAVATAGMGAAGAGAPKVAKLVKLIFKDSAAAQKAATAAAITQSWFGTFVPGRTRAGDIANMEQLARRPGTPANPSYPPWSILQVTDTWLNPGTKIYMVNYRSQTAPGGWATSKQFTSLAEARKELALLESFKNPGSDCCVLQEYIIKAPIPVREGFAGPLISKTPPFDSYPGGAKQWELLLDKSLNWRDFMDEGMAVNLK